MGVCEVVWCEQLNCGKIALISTTYSGGKVLGVALFYDVRIKISKKYWSLLNNLLLGLLVFIG